MSVTKVNKSQLSSSASEYVETVQSYNGMFSGMQNTLKSIPDNSTFSGVSAQAKAIAENLKNIYTDLGNVSKNIQTYVDCIIAIDNDSVVETAPEINEKPVTYTASQVHYSSNPGTSNNSSSYTGNKSWTTLSTGAATNAYVSNLNYTGSSSNKGNYTYSYSTGPTGTVVYTNNFSSNLLTSEDYDVPAGGKYNYEGIEKYLEEEIEGVTVTLPAGLGSVHTYMGWQCVTAKSSNQYKLREAAGMNFDEEGFAKIGDRYVIACTTTFGNVGDFIDVYQEDGTVIKCIIGDIKSQSDAGCTEWGHNNGHCVIEFVVDKDMWYGSSMHSNPGTESCHPEWNQNITKIVNKGNFFELIKTEAAEFNEEVSTTEMDISTETDIDADEETDPFEGLEAFTV